MNEQLRQRISESIGETPPPFTRRDVRLPRVRGKALAIIGVRRGGKTTFLWQCLADRLAKGARRESMLFVSFEDDRLAGIEAHHLSWMVEEYYRQYPAVRGVGKAAFFFDEIQVVPGWERFARRLMDTERADLFLSGSSAKLLSREISTSMRGRALEVVIHPFSFREVLRHARVEAPLRWERVSAAERSRIDRHLGRYLVEGGFPEAQAVTARDRFALLRSYVDVVLLRDVIERHSISHSTALRWMLRAILSSPASRFSVQKCFHALKSQGLAIAKDSLHADLAHLEDTFLIRKVPMHSASERQRMVNPPKVYPVDQGLIPIFERSGRPNLGHALETAVLLELERRGYEPEYVKTAEGYEVDFLVTRHGQTPLLLQVTVEVDDASTYEREVRALESAAREFPVAEAILLTLDSTPPRAALPAGLRWLPAARWFLSE